MNKLTGTEYLSFKDTPTNFVLKDFWAWQASELLGNTLRGAFAEYIVATALDLNLSKARQDWEPYDFLYDGRWKIEVKSSAYLQSWKQRVHSKIRFSIKTTHPWNSLDGYCNEMIRQADLYIFSLFACQDKERADPLKLEQWIFYVLPTQVLNEQCSTQKNISLSGLLCLNPEKSDYITLKDAVHKCCAKIQSYS